MKLMTIAALVALPLGVAVFPDLARLAAGGDDKRTELRRKLTTASRATWLLAIPATVGLALIAPDLVRVVFEHGLFGPDDTPRAAWTTVALVAGLPAMSVAASPMRGIGHMASRRRLKSSSR